MAARLAGRGTAGTLRPARLAGATAIGAAFGGALFVPAVGIAPPASLLPTVILKGTS